MLRIPYRTLYSKNVSTTATSFDSFLLPFQDFDSLMAKVVVATLTTWGATPALNIFVQTTDDGGATYYDCVNFGTITTTANNANAIWATLPTIGDGSYIGNVLGTSVAQGTTSKMPLLSNNVRVTWTYGTMTSTSQANWTITLSANNQSSNQ